MFYLALRLCDIVTIISIKYLFIIIIITFLTEKKYMEIYVVRMLICCQF